MSETWTRSGLDLKQLELLASRLAIILHPGDCVALSGELGAGKTTFARALIRKIWGEEGEDVVSPTFALAETYETPRMDVTHFDLFRIENESEIEELGLVSALDEGLVLIEWPDRIVGSLPEDRLEILISEDDFDPTRNLAFEAHGAWKSRLERFAAMTAFLESSGWGEATAAYLQGDASPRRYSRLARDGEAALLMDAERQPDGSPIRDGKSYGALAHLAEDVKPFVAVAAALREIGLSAPEIYAFDLDRGLLILEDFGDRVFDQEVANGQDQEELYGAAVDVLLALRARQPAVEIDIPGAGSVSLASFDRAALAIEVELLLDWFWPALKGEPAPEIVRAEFMEAWGAQIAFLDAQRRGWVLRDFHSPNLLWLPEREGVARVGIIDFQDAMRGPHAYDLVSLLQDARSDIAAELEARLLDKYCRACERADSSFDRTRFLAAYAAAGAQRSTKILGIFARLAVRDGKRGYLAHIPRVSAYLERNLEHQALAPLKDWYDRYVPQAERAQFGNA